MPDEPTLKLVCSRCGNDDPSLLEEQARDIRALAGEEKVPRVVLVFCGVCGRTSPCYRSDIQKVR